MYMELDMLILIRLAILVVCLLPHLGSLRICRAQRSTSGELARQNSVLTCPGCDCDYDTQGGKKPMSLRCGHTFCSGTAAGSCYQLP